MSFNFILGISWRAEKSSKRPTTKLVTWELPPLVSIEAESGRGNAPSSSLFLGLRSRLEFPRWISQTKRGWIGTEANFASPVGYLVKPLPALRLPPFRFCRLPLRAHLPWPRQVVQPELCHISTQAVEAFSDSVWANHQPHATEPELG